MTVPNVELSPTRRSSSTTLRSGVEKVLLNLQAGHAVGFEPQSQLELVGRQRFVIHRLIEAGVRVAFAAGFANQVRNGPSGQAVPLPRNIMCSNI